MPKIILAARGRITTRFHQDIGRGWPHRGIDQGHGDGTEEDLEIRAPADGTVIAVGPLGTYGNRIGIRHDDGTATVLAHHSRQYVVKGQRVTQGQVIARMGNTNTGKGTATGSLAVHSHQEYMAANGTQLDPILHLVSTSTASTNKTPVTIPEEDDMAIQIVKEIGAGSKGRYGVMGGKSGFSHVLDPAEVTAMLVGIGKTEKEAVRGVSPAEFDLIARALGR